MIRFITGFLLIFAAFSLVYLKTPARFLLEPRQERLYKVWLEDFQRLQKQESFSKVFGNLAKIDLHFTDPQVAEEFQDFKTPFRTTNPKGYVLKISITRWIDKNEYGYVIQHELFDQSDDKLHEFGRTYKVGYIL